MLFVTVYNKIKVLYDILYIFSQLFLIWQYSDITMNYDVCLQLST